MSDDKPLLLALIFTESACETCGSGGAVGVCPECGGIRPDNSESDLLLQMRRRALVGADKRVAGLATQLTTAAEGHVPCTAWQYGRVLADSDLLGELQRGRAVLRRLHDLDLHDSKTVGSTMRGHVFRLVDHAEAVVLVHRELTWFLPPESCGELREMVEKLARSSVDLAGATVNALVAGQSEASRSAAQFQSFLDPPVDFDRFCDLLGTLQAEPDSLDDRVGVALGIAGLYSDAHGRLDFSRVMAAASAVSDEPLLEIGRRTARYLSHVICHPHAMGSEAAVFALPASTLACLDRPLIGHRVAFELSDLLWRAHARDESGTRALVQRTLDDSPRLLASLARTDTEQRRVALDPEATPADSVADLMGFYATAAESGFRSYSWLALDLESLTSGLVVPSKSVMPMLGEISQRLAASSSNLAGLLGQAVRPELRNAANHEEFAASSDGATLEVRDGIVSADEVERALETIVACVAGMDAAILAWGLESGVILGAPSPGDDSAGADYARMVIVRSLLRVSGGEFVSVSRGPTVTLVARMPRPLVRASIIQVLAGISELWPEARKFEMLEEGGAVIAATLRESFARYRSADRETSAIAALYGVFDAAVSIGEDQGEAAQDAVVVMLRSMTVESIEGDFHGSNEVTLHVFAMRAAAARAFIETHGLGSATLDARFKELLRRTEVTASAAARGDQGAIPRMLKALTPLYEWMTQRNADFNGLFRPW